MWAWLARALGLTPHLERRVSALETWRRVHEDDARDRAFRHEADISELLSMVTKLREEIHADRNTRLELGTLNTEAILESFKEHSKEVVQEVLSAIMPKPKEPGDGR